MGISKTFIGWIKLMFLNVTSTFNLNGNSRSNFNIEHGVCQVCLLPPYLFLIVGEVLMHISKKVCSKDKLRGFSLLAEYKKQTISQHVDDSSFMVRGNNEYVDDFICIVV